MCSSYLHHFTSNFWKFPNFPIVKHSNFIGLTCKCKILMQRISLDSKKLSPKWNICSRVCGFYRVRIQGKSCFNPNNKNQLFTLEFRQGWKHQHYKSMREGKWIICQWFLFSAAVNLFTTTNKFFNPLTLTLVEVGECFIMQFNSRRGRCTQNILKGKDHILIVWGQAGLLLLEDGKGKNITSGKKKERYMNCSVSNTVKPDFSTLRHLLSTKPDLRSHDKNKSNRLTASIISDLPRMIGHYVCQLCVSYWGGYGSSNKCQSIHSGSNGSILQKNFRTSQSTAACIVW